jgi:sialic acid synthase SpsE
MAELTVTIDVSRSGPADPPYITAEMRGNHNGILDRMLSLLDAAKAAATDALKLQTFRPESITIDHHAPEFIVNGGLRSTRPGLGLKPRHRETVIGRHAVRDLAFGEPLTTTMIEGGIKP